MINGKLNKMSKPVRVKPYPKSKSCKIFSDQNFSKNKIRSNTKNQFGIFANNNLNINKINSNDENNFEKMENLRVLDSKILENFPSRPPTQQLIKRNPSPFESFYKTENKNFNVTNFKMGYFFEEKKENNLNKFNKKANTNNVNDLIPFNDVFKKNKKLNNENGKAQSFKNTKFKGNTSDTGNMLVNHNDYEIFNFKNKVTDIFDNHIIVFLNILNVIKFLKYKAINSRLPSKKSWITKRSESIDIREAKGKIHY